MYSLSRLPFLAVGLFILLLSGCTLTPPKEYTQIQVSDATQAQAWELQGKIAVKSDTEKFNTNLYWFHHQAINDLRLTTVLGTTLLTLTTNDKTATLQANGKTYEDSNPQLLLERISGWAIPMDNLPLWITGQVGSNDRVVSYNSDGTIKELISADETADWHVTFINWHQQSGAIIPKQLKIQRQDLQIKIQNSQWHALTH